MERHVMAGALTASLLLGGFTLSLAEPVAVRYAEGLVHGFLALRTLDGTLLANGDLIQVARGGRATSQLTFHFKDGSVSDETAIFTESGKFRLLSDHVTQKGPTFPRPLDMAIDAQAGRVTVRYKDDDGKEKVEDKQLELPPDLANGMMIVNLFLHHFTNDDLHKLFGRLAELTGFFLACEPRRSNGALRATSLLRIIGCNDVTLHDARLSVRAGFAGGELSQLWPDHAGWHVEERRAGWVSHCFAAGRAPGQTGLVNSMRHDGPPT